MTILRMICLFAMSLILVGCFSSDTTIQVNPDGSGRVIQRTLMRKEFLEQMKAMIAAMSQQLGGEPNAPKLTDMFSEGEARKNAANMGSGVTFVSSHPVSTEESEGAEAIYAFSDVTKLRINQKPTPPGGQAPESGPDAETTFRFEKLPNGNVLLVARFAKPQTQGESKQTPASGESSSKAEEMSPEQLQQMKALLRGLRLSMVVEVGGTLIETSSVYVDGNKVTLLEMDFSELLENDAKLKQFSKYKNPSLEEAKMLLKDLRGFKVNLEPEVRIEFR